MNCLILIVTLTTGHLTSTVEYNMVGLNVDDVIRHVEQEQRKKLVPKLITKTECKK